MDLQAKIDKFLESRIRIYPVHSNRASEIGYLCVRFLVYKRVVWDQAQKHGIDLQRVFEEGNIQEAAFISLCRNAGYEVLEAQRDFEDKKEQITAHIDGVLFDPNTKESRPFEFKSCSPNVFGALAKYQENEFLKAMTELQPKYFWLAHYPAQIMIYLYGKNAEEGLFIFKNKTSGALKIFVVKIDLEYLNGIFKKAETINMTVDFIKQAMANHEEHERFFPQRIEDRDRCKDCAFNHLCLPDIKFNEPLKIEDDPLFEKKIDRWFELEDSKNESKSLTDEINEKCRGRNRVVLGKYLIEGKETAGGGWRKKISLLGEGGE